jgi:hypothetical protein
VTREISITNELVYLMTNNLNLKIEIGEKVFEIPLCELKMKKEQIYTIKKTGLTICDDFDIKHNYNNDNEKADIIVTIILF